MKYIKDEEFIRGNCPMTKEDVRILTISKMEIEENHKVLDIGSGTGSISIQASKFCNNGMVFSIEKDKDALDTINKNIKKFNVENLKVIEGEALLVSKTINEVFNSIFIGGSCGNLKDIVKTYGLKLVHNGNIVLNFITIKNLYESLEVLNELNYETECIQVSISKIKGKSKMLIANNPIFIVTATKI